MSWIPTGRSLLSRMASAVVPVVRYVRQNTRGWPAKLAVLTALKGLRRIHGPRDFVVRTSWGFRFAGNTADLVHGAVYAVGVWEPSLTAWLQSRLVAGDVFVDVGANAGYFTLLGAACVGATGGVVAIEASPRNFELLQRNLSLNPAANVRAVNMALADEDCTVKIYPPDAGNSGTAMTWRDERRGRAPESEVPGRRLVDLLTREEAARARVIKVDVEGAEGCLESGLDELLERCHPEVAFVVEFDPKLFHLQGRDPARFLARFMNAGFALYTLDNHSVEPYWEGPRDMAPAEPGQVLAEGIVDLIFVRDSVAGASRAPRRVG